MASRRKERRLAVQALYSWEVSGTAAGDVTTFSWYEREKSEDLSFARLLVHGTLEHVSDVDRLIEEQLEHWELSRLAKVDLAILRISAYALRFQPDVPADVTIDEAVELAKELSTDDAYRFVNGVLDGIRKRPFGDYE